MKKLIYILLFFAVSLSYSQIKQKVIVATQYLKTDTLFSFSSKGVYIPDSMIISNKMRADTVFANVYQNLPAGVDTTNVVHRTDTSWIGTRRYTDSLFGAIVFPDSVGFADSSRAAYIADTVRNIPTVDSVRASSVSDTALHIPIFDTSASHIITGTWTFTNPIYLYTAYLWGDAYSGLSAYGAIIDFKSSSNSYYEFNNGYNALELVDNYIQMKYYLGGGYRYATIMDNNGIMRPNALITTTAPDGYPALSNYISTDSIWANHYGNLPSSDSAGFADSSRISDTSNVSGMADSAKASRLDSIKMATKFDVSDMVEGSDSGTIFVPPYRLDTAKTALRDEIGAKADTLFAAKTNVDNNFSTSQSFPYGVIVGEEQGMYFQTETTPSQLYTNLASVPTINLLPNTSGMLLSTGDSGTTYVTPVQFATKLNIADTSSFSNQFDLKLSKSDSSNTGFLPFHRLNDSSLVFRNDFRRNDNPYYTGYGEFYFPLYIYDTENNNPSILAGSGDGTISYLPKSGDTLVSLADSGRTHVTPTRALDKADTANTGGAKYLTRTMLNAIYEPIISAGTTAQYWRGDKSWQTLNQAAVVGLTTSDAPVFNGGTLNANLIINRAGVYNSETGLLMRSTASTPDVTTFLFSDATNHIGGLQSYQAGVSWTTRPLTLQANGGNVYVGAITGDSSLTTGSTKGVHIGRGLLVDAGIQVGAATGGNKGAGTINVATGIYLNNTAYNSPDFVFDQYFDGKNNKGYAGLLPINLLEDSLRKTHELPGFAEANKNPVELFQRTDMLLKTIEELTLYIIQLNKRIEILEKK